jgi:hypothetical protein
MIKSLKAEDEEEALTPTVEWQLVAATPTAKSETDPAGGGAGGGAGGAAGAGAGAGDGDGGAGDGAGGGAGGGAGAGSSIQGTSLTSGGATSGKVSTKVLNVDLGAQGKAAAVIACCAAHMDGSTTVVAPAFNKLSGIVEFANAIALYVSLPQPQSNPSPAARCSADDMSCIPPLVHWM